MIAKNRAGRNRTLFVEPGERQKLLSQTITLTEPASLDLLTDRLLYQDLFQMVEFLPPAFIDLLIVDPPYNLRKTFSTHSFSKKPAEEYEQWLHSWMAPLIPKLKPTASVYFCSEWQSTAPVQRVLSHYLKLRNRITWEREKGRGALRNWKNCAEDIWFATVSDDYYFNVEAVKLKRRVIAPYRNAIGAPKDWVESEEGNFRLTHPSNLWTDISVPFWSMPENTDHPTQKPEKLIAKLILASTDQQAFVFDPFCGSGTSLVVAKKLGRRFAGVEREAEYCQITIKRLAQATNGGTIQGYSQGQFWDRNSFSDQR